MPVPSNITAALLNLPAVQKALTEYINAITAENDRLKTTIPSSAAAEIAALKAQVESLKSANATLTSQITILNGKVAVLTQEKTDLLAAAAKSIPESEFIAAMEVIGAAIESALPPVEPGELT